MDKNEFILTLPFLIQVHVRLASSNPLETTQIFMGEEDITALLENMTLTLKGKGDLRLLEKYGISEEEINNFDLVEEEKCERCNRTYLILLKDHDAPFHDRESDTCPCGNSVSYKSRWITVDFRFLKVE